MDSAVTESDSASTPPGPPSRFSGRRVFRLSVILMTAPTLMGWLARWHWIFDLATHFVVQSAVLMALFLAASLALGERRIAVLAGVVLLMNVVRLAPFYLTAERAKSDGPRCRLISANVHTGNRDAAAFLALIGREDPDVVLAMEVNGRWLHELADLKARYPHFIERGRADNFGIALYSKMPFDSVETVELADSEVPTIVARMQVEDRPLVLIGTHPLPPIGGEYTGLRNRQLAALGHLAAKEQESVPVVLAGDLNTTSWSPAFADLLESSGLRDTRLGCGVQPSWPTTSPLIRIPIDHVLVSPDVTLQDRRLGDPIGSDHRPVILDFSVEPRGR